MLKVKWAGGRMADAREKAAPSESNGDTSMSIEETNRVRATLGPPLDPFLRSPRIKSSLQPLPPTHHRLSSTVSF